jgi:hypothetical protein
VVPKSAILWIIAGADFGTVSHRTKECLACVLVDSKSVQRLIHMMTDLRMGDASSASDCAEEMIAGAGGLPVAIGVSSNTFRPGGRAVMRETVV